MTIIIETPQPPVRERLVRVPADCIDDTSGPHEVHTDRVYNATPADLERAGWVEEHLLVTARAEMRELGSERDEVRLILDASAGETTADAATRLHNDWVDARERADRVERERAVDAISGRAKLAAAERERDEARAERDKLDAKLAQAEERGDLADQRAIDAIAERDEVRRQRDAEIASRDALARVLEQVERERDEARCLYEAAHCERMRITDVLQRVERERDEARAALATWQGSAEQERARIVADLRHDAEHLAWPIGTSPNEVLRGAADCIDAGWVRSEHAGTPAPAALPRATDEELFAAYQTAYIVSCGVKDPSEDQRGITRVMPAERKGIAAVAARVRREQCLVTRAVEAGASLAVRPYTFDRWTVIASHEEHGHEERVAPAADVPATVERLLGEVTR